MENENSDGEGIQEPITSENPLYVTENLYTPPGYRASYHLRILAVLSPLFYIALSIILYQSDAPRNEQQELSCCMICLILYFLLTGAYTTDLGVRNILLFKEGFSLSKKIASQDFPGRMKYGNIKEINIYPGKMMNIERETLIIERDRKKELPVSMDLLKDKSLIAEQLRSIAGEENLEEIIEKDLESYTFSFTMNSSLAKEMNEHLCRIMGEEEFIKLLKNGNMGKIFHSDDDTEEMDSDAIENLSIFLGNDIFNAIADRDNSNPISSDV